MKINEICIADYPPIKNLKIENMGNMVIIAGANGAGKSRLKTAISNTFLNSNNPLMDMTIEFMPKNQGEIPEICEVKKGSPAKQLEAHMSTKAKGKEHRDTIIQLDSDRSIKALEFRALDLSTPDPDDIERDKKFYLNHKFSDIFQDILHKIHAKAANISFKRNDFMVANPNKTCSDGIDSIPDPFKEYQDFFEKLLPGKKLEPINPKHPKNLSYRLDGSTQILPFESLSSGECEVVKIGFNFIIKKITNSIILIDEPELHLNPVLAFNLIEALKTLGGGTNQLIFFTHSADLISRYYATGNVYFISSDKNLANQACKLSDLDEQHSDIVNLMGGNLGLFAVGNKIVFIEGKEASLDKTAYYRIAQIKHQNLTFIPLGSVLGVKALENVTKTLKNTIFGISFFMIRDRDGLSESEIKSLETSSKLRCIKRRHLENYFLNAEVLLKVAIRFCLEDWKNVNVSIIKKTLLEICQNSLPEALDLSIKEYLQMTLNFPTLSTKSVEKKKPEAVIQEHCGHVVTIIEEKTKQLSPQVLQGEFENILNDLKESMKNNTWEEVFPGKIIFRKLCGNYFKVDKDRVVEAYLEIALKEHPEVFSDIINIFDEFK